MKKSSGTTERNESRKRLPLKTAAPSQHRSDLKTGSSDQSNRDAAAQEMESGLRQFASSIEFAQILWRKYPQLVEADGLEEPLLSAFRREHQEEPYYHRDVIGEEELVAAGILPKPKRIRFNRAAINERIRLAIADGFDQVARMFAEEASPEELGLLMGLMVRSDDRDTEDVLGDLLVCEEVK